MNRLVYLIFILVLVSSCGSKSTVENNLSKEKISTHIFEKESIISLMKLTSHWQVSNLPHVMELPSGIVEPLTTHNWVRATFLSGMMAYYDITKDQEILDYVNGLCSDVNYELGFRPRHADEFAIGRVYTDLYLVKREPIMLADMYKRIDEIIENPTRGPVVGWNGEKNWSWCDALFMAPPAWLKLYTCSGDRTYLNEMDVRFWDTYDYLYSQEDSLFYRDDRFFWDENNNGIKTENGYKVFWGRGNGWVIGGLTDILTYIPGDYHHRKKYQQVFVEMMHKIKDLQGEDGMWRSSMLDYDQYPMKEFSASAFFCYGMVWGVNHRILDKEIFWPHIEKAWKGMVDCIAEDGKIGHVQRVGADPQSVDADDTMEYATGAFLLAAKELYEMVED